MQNLEVIRKKIRTVQELLSVVKTMKTLAAVNIRQYEAAANALDEYYRVVELGWQVLSRDRVLPPPARKSRQAVCLVIGSDQGMCGQFNEVIQQYYLSQLPEMLQQSLTPIIWTAGERLRHGMNWDTEPDMHFFLPGSIDGIGNLMQAIIERLVEYQTNRDTRTFYIFYNRIAAAGSYQPWGQRILPIDRQWHDKFGKQPWPSTCIPMLGLPRQQLFEALFRQYLFASLYRAFAQSMASENIARLAAMQVAEKNIEEMREHINALYRETRQNTITEELFDVVAGFEAISKNDFDNN